jgi:dolichol-phosphate mannosyltransferase
MVDYSIVLPCYNEVESLGELTDRLVKVLTSLGGTYELLFVDDGSIDETFRRLKDLKAQHPANVRVLRLSRNFGHHFAITAGLDHSRGQTVVIMDSDLQMLPEEIPALVGKLKEGYDIAYAVWKERNDPPAKRMLSSGFNWMINHMTRLPLPINSSIFRAVNRRTVDALIQLREQSRFVTGLFSWIGFRQVGVPVALGQRKFGAPKYSFGKSLELAMRTIVAFTHFPLQLLFYLSFLTFFVAFLLTIGLATGTIVLNNGGLVNLVVYFQAMNFFVFGMLGEYLGRVLYETQKRPLYIVAEEI